MRALFLIKEKRDGCLKGRTVADGRSQRAIYSKAQTTSSTVSTDGLVLSIIEDAFEQRDVGTADTTLMYLVVFRVKTSLLSFRSFEFSCPVALHSQSASVPVY